MAKTCKYYKLVRQVSYDSGQTWSNVTPLEVMQGDLYQSGATDCSSSGDTGYTATYRWVDGGVNCVFTDKWAYQKEQVSYDGGVTWADTGNIGDAVCIETDSADCGWEMPDMTGLKYYKEYATFGNHTIYCDDASSIVPTSVSSVTAPCDSSGITTADTKNPTGWTTMRTFIVGDCVPSIASGAFRFYTGSPCGGEWGQAKLHIMISSSVTSIGMAAFEGSMINKLKWDVNTQGITLGEECFSGATINEIDNLPTTIVRLGTRAFASATINKDTLTFDKKVYLDWPALAGCPFKTIVFNNGFICSISNSSAFDYTYNTELIVLNGNRSDYPSNYKAAIRNSNAIIQDNTI